LIFGESILHIPLRCKGQTCRKAGTQSHRSNLVARDLEDREVGGHDSGVARMYNTNDRLYVRHTLQMHSHRQWHKALETAVAVKARLTNVSSRRVFSGSEGIMA
jgi:hypothetical protein